METFELVGELLGGVDTRLLDLHRTELDQAGRRGASEALASVVVYGYFDVLGHRVRVTLDWPDERIAAMAREMSLNVLRTAHEAGRRQEPPTA